MSRESAGETVRVFVQARMKSERFPGKVLAPLAGDPVIAHVVRRLATVVPRELITVATSLDASDEPLALYAASLGVSVFRGPLDDVFERFRLCLLRHQCDWFVRICADSPLLDVHVLRQVIRLSEEREADLITNAQIRTFPAGNGVEAVKSATFASIDPSRLNAVDREHVTRFYYSHPDEFRIVNVAHDRPDAAGESVAVDTFDDLRRLERLITSRSS